MHKKTSLFSLLALCGLVAAPLAQDGEKEEKPPVEQAQKVYKLGSTVDEKLALRDLDKNQITFADLRGKVVLIHFWSTTCPYEIVADPKFVALEERWKDRDDVVILAINANSSEIGIEPPKEGPGYESVREHLKKKDLPYTVYADHGNVVADLFQAKSTPHCFVLDKKGVVVYAGGLDDDPKGEKGPEAKQYARDAVEAVLAGKEVAVKESKPYGCSIKRVRS